MLPQPHLSHLRTPWAAQGREDGQDPAAPWGPNGLSWVTKSHYTPETVPAASSALQHRGKGPFIFPLGKLRH